MYKTKYIFAEKSARNAAEGVADLDVRHAAPGSCPAGGLERGVLKMYRGEARHARGLLSTA